MSNEDGLIDAATLREAYTAGLDMWGICPAEAKKLALRNDLGLLTEEYDPVQQRQLGNFPQAFSHMGLIQSARLLQLLATQSSHHRGTVAVPAPRSTSRSTRQTCAGLTPQHA
jgi:hypothetical protein